MFSFPSMSRSPLTLRWDIERVRKEGSDGERASSCLSVVHHSLFVRSLPAFLTYGQLLLLERVCMSSSNRKATLIIPFFLLSPFGQLSTVSLQLDRYLLPLPCRHWCRPSTMDTRTLSLSSFLSMRARERQSRLRI